MWVARSVPETADRASIAGEPYADRPPGRFPLRWGALGLGLRGHNPLSGGVVERSGVPHPGLEEAGRTWRASAGPFAMVSKTSASSMARPVLPTRDPEAPPFFAIPLLIPLLAMCITHSWITVITYTLCRGMAEEWLEGRSDRPRNRKQVGVSQRRSENP